MHRWDEHRQTIVCAKLKDGRETATGFTLVKYKSVLLSMEFAILFCGYIEVAWFDVNVKSNWGEKPLDEEGRR